MQVSRNSDQVAAAIVRIRDEWGPIIQAMITACDGSAQAVEQLTRFFEMMSQKDDWRHLVAVLRGGFTIRHPAHDFFAERCVQLGGGALSLLHFAAAKRNVIACGGPAEC